MVSSREIQELEDAKREYLRAKLLYEEKLKRLSEVVKPVDELCRRGEISLDEALELELKAEEEVGSWEAFQQLKKMEEELVNVAEPILLREAEKTLPPEEVKLLKVALSCNYINIRGKVVELILRWNPAKP
jgi:hypothetical protein